MGIDMYQWLIPGNPVPKGNHQAFPYRDKLGNIRVRVTDRKGKVLVAWQDAIALEVGKDFSKPLDGVFHLKIEFILQRPKNHWTKSGKPSSQWVEYPTKKPDIDKLIRAVLDGLTGTMYIDDNQVISVNASKRYTKLGESPGVKIEL